MDSVAVHVREEIEVSTTDFEVYSVIMKQLQKESQT